MALDTPLNLDGIKSRKSRIYKIGVELEGGWLKLPGPDVAIIRDGSVVFDDIAVDPPRYVGELPSPPMDLIDMPKWIKSYYPSHINDTCGLHVHMSFETAFIYQMLMCKEYPSTVVEYFKKWGEAKKIPTTNGFWPRVEGKSEYCQHVFHADFQATAKRKEYDRHAPKHRYTVINYCWHRFKTLECRLLPMMATPEEAIEAINELVSITDRFLVASTKNAKVKVIESIELDSSNDVEELNEII